MVCMSCAPSSESSAYFNRLCSFHEEYSGEQAYFVGKEAWICTQMPSVPTADFSTQKSFTFVTMQSIPNMKLPHPRERHKFENLITSLTCWALTLFSRFTLRHVLLSLQSQQFVSFMITSGALVTTAAVQVLSH